MAFHQRDTSDTVTVSRPGLSPRTSSTTHPRAACFLLLLCCSLLRTAHAQSTPPATPYTFHIYEDLVQVPTLVLDRQLNTYPGLTAPSFSLQLDAGPAFHPRHLRLEGEDPITLAILVDASSPGSATGSETLLKEPDLLAASLPANLLTATDRFSLYAADCTLIRSVDDAPFSRTLLAKGLSAALASPGLHAAVAAQTGRSHCNASLKLWDTLNTVVSQLSASPGRRVLFVLTDGHDEGSQITWRDLARNADAASVSILGFRPEPDTPTRIELGASPQTVLTRHAMLPTHAEELFNLLCGATGGLTFYVEPKAFPTVLEHAVNLLRNRYILEFARPANGTTGIHQLKVALADKSAVIRPSGLSFPTKDKTLLTDPSTLTNDPTRAPEEGTRKTLTPPH